MQKRKKERTEIVGAFSPALLSLSAASFLINRRMAKLGKFKEMTGFHPVYDFRVLRILLKV